MASARCPPLAANLEDTISELVAMPTKKRAKTHLERYNDRTYKEVLKLSEFEDLGTYLCSLPDAPRVPRVINMILRKPVPKPLLTINFGPKLIPQK